MGAAVLEEGEGFQSISYKWLKRRRAQVTQA
jgi:hypothetical protein